jgi:hypothetical protein
VTVADIGANLATLTSTQIKGMTAKGVDRIDSTDNALPLTVARYKTLGTVALMSSDVVTLADTGANIGALLPADLAALAAGVHRRHDPPPWLGPGVADPAGQGTARPLISWASPEVWTSRARVMALRWRPVELWHNRPRER